MENCKEIEKIKVPLYWNFDPKNFEEARNKWLLEIEKQRENEHGTKTV